MDPGIDDIPVRAGFAIMAGLGLSVPLLLGVVGVGSWETAGTGTDMAVRGAGLTIRSDGTTGALIVSVGFGTVSRLRGATCCPSCKSR